MAITEQDLKQDTAIDGKSDHIDELKDATDSKAPDAPKDLPMDMSESDYAAAEKRLVRKLDMTLVPVVWLLYLFNYLDRNNIA